MYPGSRLAARLPRLAMAVFAVVTVFAIFAPTTAKAGTRYYNGCLICKADTSSQNDYCGFPPSSTDGFTKCKEVDTVLGTACYSSGYECLYVCFGCDPGGGGGTGGGGGGGGGGSCDTSGGSCPPECFDCGGMYY